MFQRARRELFIENIKSLLKVSGIPSIIDMASPLSSIRDSSKRLYIQLLVSSFSNLVSSQLSIQRWPISRHLAQGIEMTSNTPLWMSGDIVSSSLDAVPIRQNQLQSRHQVAGRIV
jgi:hypothetical protein